MTVLVNGFAVGRAALRLALAAGLAVAPLVVGLLRPQIAASAASALVEVEITSSELKPRSANIERGGTVVWKNTSQQPQLLQSEAGLFQIQVKASERYTQTFGTEGTYFYFSAIDPRLQGAVVVGSGRPNFGHGTTPLSVPDAGAPPLAPFDGYAYGGGYSYPLGYGYGGGAGYGGGCGGYGGCGSYGYGGYGGYGYGGYGGYGYGGGSSGYFVPPSACPYPYTLGYGYGGYGYGGFGSFGGGWAVPYYGYPGYGSGYVPAPVDLHPGTMR